MIGDKCQVTLNSDNFEQWRSKIISDANLIHATAVLFNETHPPELNLVDRAVWQKKSDFMRARMIIATTSSVCDAIGDVSNAAQAWHKISIMYGMSLAKERFRTMQDFYTLKLENNDYLSY